MPQSRTFLCEALAYFATATLAPNSATFTNLSTPHFSSRLPNDFRSGAIKLTAVGAAG